MISASRRSVCSKDQESREAFCCISRALVATPPAFAAFPGANPTPASTSSRTAAGVHGMFAPSATITQPWPTRVAASASSSSFWVAQGSAIWQGTSQTEPPATNRAEPPAASAYALQPLPPHLVDLGEELDIDTALVHDIPAGVPAGDHRATELVDLRDRVRRDVP